MKPKKTFVFLLEIVEEENHWRQKSFELWLSLSKYDLRLRFVKEREEENDQILFLFFLKMIQLDSDERRWTSFWTNRQWNFNVATIALLPFSRKMFDLLCHWWKFSWEKVEIKKRFYRKVFRWSRHSIDVEEDEKSKGDRAINVRKDKIFVSKWRGESKIHWGLET